MGTASFFCWFFPFGGFTCPLYPPLILLEHLLGALSPPFRKFYSSLNSWEGQPVRGWKPAEWESDLQRGAVLDSWEVKDETDVGQALLILYV